MKATESSGASLQRQEEIGGLDKEKLRDRCYSTQGCT